MVEQKMSRLTSKVTAKQLDMYTIEAQEERQMKEVPLKVLFNPVITPVDNTQVGLPNLSGLGTVYDYVLFQVIMRESCCSMHGFSGPVPRAMSVHVKGLNEVRKIVTFQLILEKIDRFDIFEGW